MICFFWFTISNCTKTKLLIFSPDIFPTVKVFIRTEQVATIVETEGNDFHVDTESVLVFPNFSNLVFHQIRVLLLLFKA